MTPPDSGELRHECRCGYHIVGRDAEGAHTWSKCKPDSGEREVCKATRIELCGLQRGHDGPHYPKLNPEWTLIPLSLAQRILAALDGHCGLCVPLADELRAIVERKTTDQRKGP